MSIRPLHSLLVAGVALLALAACGSAPPPTAGADPTVRLLTEPQYRQIIADVFGSQIVVGGTFDPMVRTNGLLAVGASQAHVTPAGLEQFDRMARAIAAQVVAADNRDVLVPCRPARAESADEACARAFFGQAGRLLYRHPLSAEELRVPVAVAGEAADRLGSFYDGLAAGLAGMLVSPSFLFVIESTEPDPAAPGKVRLDAFSKAQRLSFFLWGSTPDDALLAAAEKGELHERDGLEAQVERMVASPRLESGMRMFFNDMLAFEDLARLEKDSLIYPAFSAAVAADAREQTLRTIVDQVITHRGDYRDLFTTRKTFISGPLGRIYRVPVARPDAGFMPYEFPEDDPRAGLITQVSFAALYSHPGRSSPTLRGRAIRELLLCQKVPDPPGNVDFSLFNDPNAPQRTARDRLTAHATQAACSGCHKLTDPIGLGMENLDGAGQLRTDESGAPIDAAGNLDGIDFKDVAGLGRAMRENPAAPACVVDRLYAYGTARAPLKSEKALLEYFTGEFADSGYRVPELLREIATSDALFAVKAPAVQSAAVVQPAPGDPS
ncbi:MAG: DUF1592 domain-containing protein [Steroidobacteraceae bacterium]|jgi:hypothetical protein|nr:DUF1592 domain-containing protein [Steroidobacteraceae bacterium]